MPTDVHSRPDSGISAAPSAKRDRGRYGVRYGAVWALALLLTLSLAEWGTRKQLPAEPGSDVAARNPYRYRAWPEYMAGLRNTAHETSGSCVIISNCQGYGGEYTATMGYPAELGRRLRERGTANREDWQVHNWSVDGATSLDYMFMAAWLSAHPPDIVIVLTGYADYRAEHFNEGFGYSRTDLSRLYARKAVREALPKTFVKRHGHVEDRLKALIHDSLSIVRARDYLWSRLDQRRIGGLFNACYAPRLRYLPWRLPRRPDMPRINHPRTEDEPELKITYNHLSRQMLAEYLDLLALIPAPVFVAAQPYEYAEAEPARRMAMDAEQLCLERGLVFQDLGKALPMDDFLTSAHFNRQNHVRMSYLLADIIDSMLADDH